MTSTNRKVLVVDDDPNILLFIETLLSSEGYNVITAVNGKEALRACEGESPDVAFVDLVMPIMNGWEFCEAVRERGRRQIPIVVMSASADARRASREVGAQGYLGKPFELDQVLAYVRKLTAPRSPTEGIGGDGAARS
ncbi:MAG: response regulator [Chloroflexi bacterium]|nr:response regulator [Chloroflexota bacterium]